jgi:hypothetical protein
MAVRSFTTLIPVYVWIYTASYPRIQKDSSSYYYYSDLFLPTHRRCRGLLLHMITVRHTTLGRTHLDEWSAHRRDLYLKHHSHETGIHAPDGIRSRSTSKRATADPRTWPRDPWGHLNILCLLMVLVWCTVCELLPPSSSYWVLMAQCFVQIYGVCPILLIIPQCS